MGYDAKTNEKHTEHTHAPLKNRDQSQLSQIKVSKKERRVWNDDNNDDEDDDEMKNSYFTLITRKFRCRIEITWNKNNEHKFNLFSLLTLSVCQMDAQISCSVSFLVYLSVSLCLFASLSYSLLATFYIQRNAYCLVSPFFPLHLSLCSRCENITLLFFCCCFC